MHIALKQAWLHRPRPEASLPWRTSHPTHLTTPRSYVQSSGSCGRDAETYSFEGLCQQPGVLAQVDLLQTSVAALAACPRLRVDTVVMNPPFGTRQKGADVDFLNVACQVGSRCQMRGVFRCQCISVKCGRADALSMSDTQTARKSSVSLHHAHCQLSRCCASPLDHLKATRCLAAAFVLPRL